MKLIESHIVTTLKNPIRLQEYAVGIFKNLPSKSGIKKAIKKGLILVDGQKATTAKFMLLGEKIELYQNKNHENVKEINLTLEVLFEDDYLAVIYKPSGILVSGNTFFSIDNALAQNLKKSTQFNAVRPRPNHRLDYPTSGLLLIGKTNSIITSLNKMFENKEINKSYYAVTIGGMKEKGTIELPVDNKVAKTKFDVISTVKSERFGYLNLVKISPKTGRKHQIRKHLCSIGNPILGDKLYYKNQLILNGKGLYLHANSLQFKHPITQKSIKIKTNFPNKFLKIFPLENNIS